MKTSILLLLAASLLSQSGCVMTTQASIDWNGSDAPYHHDTYSANANINITEKF